MISKEKNNALVNAREELGLDRYQISKTLGISIGVYGSYEANRMNPPEKIQDEIVDFFYLHGLLVNKSYLFQEKINPGRLLEFEF